MGLLKSFQGSILAQQIDKRKRHEAYSFIGARMSKSNWLFPNYSSPSLSMVRLAAQLAWKGHLRSVKKMRLENMDLSDIHQDHIFKLASIVTQDVKIDNIMPASLDIILESVRCSELWLWNMRLTEPQTRALVTSLTERLKTVRLYDDVTLDIQTLCQYNGQGTCWQLVVWGDTRRRYQEKLRQWIEEVSWAVTRDGVRRLTMQRK